VRAPPDCRHIDLRRESIPLATASVPAGGQIRIGGILGRALKVYRANILTFCAATFVSAAPNLLLGRTATMSALPVAAKWLIFFTLATCLNTLAQAVILFGAYQHLRAEPVRPSAALHHTLARFFPLLGFTILYWLGLAGGLLLLVAPGLIWLTMWSVALPACSLEGLGPIDCMRRSAHLTKGSRWKVFAILALAIITSLGGAMLIDLLLRPFSWLAKASGSVIWSTVPGAYWDSVFGLVYFDLRSREGTDAIQVAAIFD
jgi:hypothetical protein